MAVGSGRLSVESEHQHVAARVWGPFWWALGSALGFRAQLQCWAQPALAPVSCTPRGRCDILVALSLTSRLTLVRSEPGAPSGCLVSCSRPLGRGLGLCLVLDAGGRFGLGQGEMGLFSLGEASSSSCGSLRVCPAVLCLSLLGLPSPRNAASAPRGLAASPTLGFDPKPTKPTSALVPGPVFPLPAGTFGLAESLTEGCRGVSLSALLGAGTRTREN